MSIRKHVVRGLSLSAGLGAGMLAAQQLHAAPLQSATESQGHGAICAGTEGSIDLSLATIGQSSGADGDTFTLRVEAGNHAGRAASMAYRYEFVDADGNAVQGAEVSAIENHDDGDALVGVITTPGGLANGYYIARVSAVSSDGTDATSVSDDRYFRVRNGKMAPISADRFMKRSGIMKSIEE